MNPGARGAGDNDNVVPLMSKEIVAQLRAQGIDPQELISAMLSGDFMAALESQGDDPASTDPLRRRPPSVGAPRPDVVTFRVRMDLAGAQPPIWRRLDLASDLTLDRVHAIIMAAMGWYDSHLHAFVMGPAERDWAVQPFATAYDVDFGESEEDAIPEADVRLDQVLARPGDRLFHDYDFGDGWEHVIELEKVITDRPADAPEAVCVAGRRACPPEDCGGLGGFDEILALFSSADSLDREERESLLEWLPDGYDPAHFDVAEVNEDLADLGDGRRPGTAAVQPHYAPVLRDYLDRVSTASRVDLTSVLADARLDPPPAEMSETEALEATHGLRALLERVGTDGAPLTGAGRLKPAVVEALVAELGLTGRVYGKGNREDNVVSVMALRAAATGLRLVRKHKDRLLLAPAGRKLRGDPRGLVDHVVTALPLGKHPSQHDAGVVLLLMMAAGQDWWLATDDSSQLLAAAGWTYDGRSPTPHDLRALGEETQDVLFALDSQREARRHDEAPPPHLAHLARLALTSRG